MPADSPLRLAFLADPNSIHTRRWVAWFARAGHDVHIIDPFGVQVAPGLADGVSVDAYGPLPRGLPLVGLLSRRRAVRGELARLGTQVLHAHSVRRYAWLAALSGFHPLVVSPWGSDILRVSGHQVRTRWWNGFALRRADLVTVSSEGMRAASIRSGARAERIELVHHGVDMRQFAPGDPGPAIHRLVRGDGAPVIVSPRTILPLYRQEVVVDAVAALAARGIPATLVMSARAADPAYLDALRTRAASAGIGNRLRVLDDVPHEQLGDLFRLADVVVSVPESDSFPVTLLEAMACGRPIVVSDLPAVTPVLAAIGGGAAALIAPVGDAPATADAIHQALSMDDEQRDELGARLRDFVQRTADYETNMARMETLYRRLTDQA